MTPTKRPEKCVRPLMPKGCGPTPATKAGARLMPVAFAGRGSDFRHAVNVGEARVGLSSFHLAVSGEADVVAVILDGVGDAMRGRLVRARAVDRQARERDDIARFHQDVREIARFPFHFSVRVAVAGKLDS